MGISYGVAVCLDAKVKQDSLEEVAKDILEPLRHEGVVLRVYHWGARTLLAQGDGDHARLWPHRSVFARFAQALAKRLRARAWNINGYTGSVDQFVVQGFDEHGKRTWAAKNGPAMRRLATEAGFKHEPFSWDVKPFLDVAPEWKQVGEVSIVEENGSYFTPVKGRQLANLLGRSLPGVTAHFYRQPTDLADGRETDVYHLFLECRDKRTLARWGLEEVGWWQPEFAVEQRDDLVVLPNGQSVRGYFNSVRGLPCARLGKRLAQIRWGHTLLVTGSRWLHVFVVEGPFTKELKRIEDEAAQHEAHSLLERALKKDDVALMSKAVKVGRIDGFEVAVLAGEAGAWKCFEVVARKLSPRHAQAARDRLLWRWPWKKALQHGADINAPVRSFSQARLIHEARTAAEAKTFLRLGASLEVLTEGARTPLHAASQPDVALVLLEAGAPLDVEDANGRTPFESFLYSLGFATPSPEDLAVVREFVRRKAPPTGKRLAAALRTLKRNKSAHAAVSAILAAAS